MSQEEKDQMFGRLVRERTAARDNLAAIHQRLKEIGRQVTEAGAALTSMAGLPPDPHSDDLVLRKLRDATELLTGDQLRLLLEERRATLRVIAEADEYLGPHGS